MNSLRDRDTDRERDFSTYQPREYDRDPNRGSDRERARTQDREISLGTGTILGIFFALALLCAVFFAFGYSMGRKSSQPIASTADAIPTTSLFGGTKPAPGSPRGSSSKMSPPVSVPPPASEADSGQEQAPDSSTLAPQEAAYNPRQLPISARSPASAVSVDTTPPAVIKPAKPVIAAVPATAGEAPMPPINPNGTVMVQVAAVSHQEDADLLLSALKNRGYAVFTRQETQDRLLHVQVGPFATRKDAEAMRQRLLADGYNAIVK